MNDTVTTAGESTPRNFNLKKSDAARDYPRDATLHQLISEQSARTPEAIALVFKGQEFSYSELERRSNQLANRLLAMGLAANQPVALVIERSLEMIVGLLGIMKAGGAYIPVDPAYPADRVAYMLEDSESRIILTEAGLLDGLPANSASILCLDRDWPQIAEQPEEAPAARAGAEDLAYIIYTSGSTGHPKGVEIPHRALVNFMGSLRREPGLSADDRLLAVTTLSFDIAGLELYLPLVVGATVVLASRSLASDGRLLAAALEEESISVMQATPASWRLLLEAGWNGKADLRIFCGGETLPRDLAEQLLPRCAELWNLYGPTEATIWSTLQRVESGDGPVPIGHAIANTEIQILDDALRPVAPGATGELFIGGDGLARGYFKRPELTAERFLDHPLEPGSGKRLYRTGDVARYHPDGSLEHQGRVDFQVKVRGFRIELGEIEATLEQQPAVRQAVVLAREDRPGDKQLVAYVRSKDGKEATSRALREALHGSLPDYMVPGLFVFLEAFPLTPNGKVDRNALPAPAPGGAERSEEYLAPRNEGEKRLAALWSKVLRVEKIGVNDDFFELGGDSLKVAQVATRIRESFKVDMPLRLLFENPTIAALLPVVEALPPAAAGMEELPLVDVVRGDVIPLTFAQERVWFIHQLNPDNLAYNFHSWIAFRGKLDFAALQKTLEEVLRRHESYRSSFPMIDGRPQQIVHPAEPYSLTLVDFSVQPEDRREAALKAWCAEEFDRRFDLNVIPLVHWTLVKMGEDDHRLMHSEHHLVHDGWSFNIFLCELVDLYRAFTKGEPSPLPELPVQFAEFATWQHQWMQGAVSDHQLAYWKERLKTIPPVLDLPHKGPRPASQTFRGTSLRPEIPLDLCNDLRALSRQEGSTLFMTMLAGFMAMLHRYSGETDVAIGTFFANRRQEASEGLIGMILNNVVIRASLESNPTVREFVAQVRDLLLEGAENQDVPFDRVVEAVQPKRDLSYNPLFQVMFSFHDEPMPEETLEGLDVKLTPVLSNGSAKFDLGVIGIPHSAQYVGLPQGSDQDALTMIWEHNTDLFETSTIARMIEHYKILLAAMVADPEQRISDLPIGSAEERRQQLVEWNATAADVPGDACLPDLIQAQAARSPDAVAVVFENQALSYGELERRANQLAHHLRGLGVTPGRLVGLCVERSPAMLVGLLGIMKAGGAYVPIDPTFPRDRQTFMVEDAKITLLVSEGDLCRDLAGEGTTLVRLDDAASWAGQPETAPEGVGLGPEDLAYVIYTSGSTGLPKGVRLPHRAVVNFLTTMAEKPGLTAEDRLFAVTTLSFDIAGLELYLPLTVGARVIIASRAVATNGELLAEQLRDSGATVMQATPTTWQMLIDSGWQGDPAFTALCGGEALPRSLAEQLLPRVKRLWNMYGPTETTIWSTVQQVESGDGPVPIGKPIANTQVYLLDAYNKMVPPGVIGELCIGGQGVALGYLDRPELTAERFIANPVEGAPPGTIYRTGDLARYQADGTLICLGRTDHQIKMRGFRIELGEIETLLERQAAVRQAVVVLREDVPGDQRLVAYLVPAEEGASLSTDVILAGLRDHLPDYMVPSMAVVLNSLPQTPNGKIDRKALPAPQGTRQRGAATYLAPRNQVERELQAVWQEIIGVEPLGVRDDFFEVGGHSLLAVRLVAAIESRLGQRITLASLLQGRTIEAIARMLGATEVEREPAAAPTGEVSFLALQSSGGRSPFFAVGSHPRYRELARRLGEDQPFYQFDVYALQSQRLSQGLKPYARIEDMAACYVEELQKVQPEGPYRLGGGCEGAYVAFEAALQLQRQGHKVERLILWIPPAMREAPGFVLGRTLPGRWAKQLSQFVSAGAYSNLRPGTFKLQLRHEYLDCGIFRAIDRYLPGSTFEGAVTIVRTEFSPRNSRDLNQQWFDFTTENGSVHTMPGDHATWLDDNHISNFSDLLKATLQGD